MPTMSNVGLAGIGNPALTAISGNTVSTSGVTYANRVWAGDLYLKGDHNTLVGCKVTGRLYHSGDYNAVLDSDVACASLGGGGSHKTIKRCRWTGMVDQDGIHLSSDPIRVSDVLLEGNYIGNPMIPDTSNAHYDGIQVRGVDRLAMYGNFFDVWDGVETYEGSYNSTVFLQDANGGNYDVLMDGNWSRHAGAYHFYFFAYRFRIQNHLVFRYPSDGLVYGTPYPYEYKNVRWQDNLDPITLKGGTLVL